MTIWHWVCSNIPKNKDFRGYHPSFGTYFNFRIFGCFYWAPWPYFSEFPYENQWVSGQYSQLSDYFLKNEIRLKNAQDMYEYKNVRKWPFFFAKNQEILKMSHFYLNELSLTIRTGFLWVNVTIWHWVCSNIPKIKDFRGTILRLVTMSFLAHFCKKLTFYFASCDFNFGNFVMKLSGEEVNIVTYLPVLKNRKSVKNQVIYGQKKQEKIRIFGKIEKNPNFFWISNFF